jgi:hypothetical protein
MRTNGPRPSQSVLSFRGSALGFERNAIMRLPLRSSRSAIARSSARRSSDRFNVGNAERISAQMPLLLQRSERFLKASLVPYCKGT